MKSDHRSQRLAAIGIVATLLTGLIGFFAFGPPQEGRIDLVRLAEVPEAVPLYSTGAHGAGLVPPQSGARVQYAGRFDAGSFATLERPALLINAAVGEPEFFVNGAPLFEEIRHGAPSMITPGARAVVVDVPRHYWHLDSNRLDILTDMGLSGPLSGRFVMGEREALGAALDRRDAILLGLRGLWPGLGALCTALALGLSAARGRSTAWLGLALAGAGASGLALAFTPHGGTVPPPAAALGHGFAVLAATSLAATGGALAGARLSPWRRRLTATLALAALIAVLTAPILGPYGSLAPPFAALSGLGAVALIGFSAARANVDGARRGAGAALLLTGGLMLALQGGLAPGLIQAQLDLVAALGLTTILIVSSGYCGAALTRILTDAFKDSRSLLEIVQRQRAELDAASIALADEARQRAILEERQRLVRDMHDGIGGQLASLVARLQTGDMAKEQIERAVHDGLKDLRLIVDSLDSAGDRLGDALRAFQTRAAPQLEAAGVALEWRQDEGLSSEIDDPQAVLMIYRWLQEAVTNTARHSGAARCVIEIKKPDAGGLVISVRDDGSGFPPDPETSQGKGLRHLDQRARRLGGRFERGAGPGGAGAEVRLILPRLPGMVSPNGR